MNEKTSVKTSDLSELEANTEGNRQTFMSKTVHRAKSIANDAKPYIPAILLSAAAAFLFWRAANAPATSENEFDSEETEN